MIKLIKLELRRNNLKNYITCTFVFCIILLIFTYFVAYVAKVENEVQFMHYDTIFRFTNAISIILFGVLSSAMYCQFVIKEYSGKKLTLLFSYPGSRKKIFLAKILLIFSFIFVGMILCTTIPIFIFTITESYMHIVSDTITFDVLLSALRTTIVSNLSVSTIGLVSMRIGFIKKSIPVTLISAFLFTSLYGNIAVGTDGSLVTVISVIFLTLIFILFLLIRLSNTIESMEVY